MSIKLALLIVLRPAVMSCIFLSVSTYVFHFRPVLATNGLESSFAAPCLIMSDLSGV